MSDQAWFLALATLAERHADAVRSDAERLARATDACQWDGAAARRFRAEARWVFSAMRSAAARLDDTAAELRRHAALLPHELAQRGAQVRGFVHGVEHEFDVVFGGGR